MLTQKHAPALSTQLFRRREKPSLSRLFLFLVFCVLSEQNISRALFLSTFRNWPSQKLRVKLYWILPQSKKKKKKPATKTCNKNPKTYMILYRHITPETSPRTAIVFKYKSSAYISKAASGCLTWVNFISFLALPGGQLKVIPD